MVLYVMAYSYLYPHRPKRVSDKQESLDIPLFELIYFLKVRKWAQKAICSLWNAKLMVKSTHIFKWKCIRNNAFEFYKESTT
jgi:hypothetical protein